MRRLALACLLAGVGCEGKRLVPPPPPAAPSVPAPAALPPAAPPPAAPAAVPDDPALHAEERETDPRSEKVKVKLVITPGARGTVHWGRKKLADLQPGRMTMETERPRNSGPLDLLVRADGFLPHHVRVFTDRDDKLSVRLVRTEDAPNLLGYRRAPAEPPPP